MRKEVAPSTMSLIEDQTIVERALSASACSSPDPAPLIPRLRGRVLGFNPRALGFHCISHGISLLYGQQDVLHPQETGNLTDWDGFGIVETKEDIVALINDFKPQLYALLWIEKEEIPNSKGTMTMQ